MGNQLLACGTAYLLVLAWIDSQHFLTRSKESDQKSNMSYKMTTLQLIITSNLSSRANLSSLGNYKHTVWWKAKNFKLMLALFPPCHIQGRLIYIMTVVAANYTFPPNQGSNTSLTTASSALRLLTAIHCFLPQKDLEWFLCVNLSIGPSHPAPLYLLHQDLISKRNHATPKTKT